MHARHPKLCLRAVFLLCFRNPLAPEYDTDLLFSRTKKWSKRTVSRFFVGIRFCTTLTFRINFITDKWDRYVTVNPIELWLTAKRQRSGHQIQAFYHLFYSYTYLLMMFTKLILTVTQNILSLENIIEYKEKSSITCMLNSAFRK